jgi:hypothetical protein
LDRQVACLLGRRNHLFGPADALALAKNLVDRLGGPVPTIAMVATALAWYLSKCCACFGGLGSHICLTCRRRLLFRGCRFGTDFYSRMMRRRLPEGVESFQFVKQRRTAVHTDLSTN